MNRFDTTFNEVDPATGRPFSRGQPDGVWIISILQILALLGWIVAAMMAMGRVWRPEFVGKWFLILTPLGILPAYVLLIRRRALAFSWMAGFLIILALVGSPLIYQQALTGQVDVGMIFAILIQGCATYYVFTLVRDGILRNPDRGGRKA